MELAGNTSSSPAAARVGWRSPRFLLRAAMSLVCGCRPDALQAAQAAHRGVHIHVGDVETAPGRRALFEWAIGEFPQLNVLVNNAGIQRRVPCLADEDDWERTHQEIAINFEAPLHLSALFIPHLRKQKRAAIMNVTSGLGFAPIASAPIYSATKAALHSFTLSLRHQLLETPIRVAEIIPPAVNTDLGGVLHTLASGGQVRRRGDGAHPNGDLEVACFSEQASRASRADSTRCSRA
jgi:uncharacterized oxidoreductase